MLHAQYKLIAFQIHLDTTLVKDLFDVGDCGFDTHRSCLVIINQLRPSLEKGLEIWGIPTPPDCDNLRDPSTLNEGGPLIPITLENSGAILKMKSGLTGIIAVTPASSEAEAVMNPILIRADIDALPDGEGGSLHMCGHHIHTAGSMRLAQTLSERPANRKAVIVFQPAEEIGLGARYIINSRYHEAVLNEGETYEAAFAVHLAPEIELGEVSFPICVHATCDKFDVNAASTAESLMSWKAIQTVLENNRPSGDSISTKTDFRLNANLGAEPPNIIPGEATVVLPRDFNTITLNTLLNQLEEDYKLEDGSKPVFTLNETSLSIQGKQCHVKEPEKGINAESIAVKIVEEWGGEIQGISETISGALRTFSTDVQERIISDLGATFKDQFNLRPNPTVAVINTTAYKSHVDLLAEQCGVKAVDIKEVNYGGDDAGFFISEKMGNGLPNLGLGGGLIRIGVSSDFGLLHSTQFVNPPIETVHTISALLEAIIRRPLPTKT